MKSNLVLLTATMLAPIFQSCTKPIDKIDPFVNTFTISGTAIGSDALSTDKFGNLYASDNIGTSSDPYNGNGTIVYKISPTGQRSIFTDNLEGPAGSCFDNIGNFFVCAFRGGQLVKIKPDGTKQTFATGLEGPIQVVSDRQNNLFVTVAGTNDAPGTKIYKFTPQGQKSVLANLASLQGFSLSGLAIDAFDNLYAANYANGIIHKITPQGAASVFTDLSSLGAAYTPFTSYLSFVDGNIYATGLFANRIYKIKANGTATVLTGTGVEGSQDGALETATFTNPNGVAADPTGNVLYISESLSKRIRRVVALKKL